MSRSLYVILALPTEKLLKEAQGSHEKIPRRLDGADSLVFT